MYDEVTGFNNIERGRQKILFKGINRIRNIRPTDIDAVIGYRDKLFIWFESKVRGNGIPTGQNRLFKDLCNVIKKGGSVSYCVIFEHNTPTNEDVIMKDQLVTQYYSSKTGKWHTPKTIVNVLQAIEAIEEKENVK